MGRGSPHSRWLTLSAGAIRGGIPAAPAIHRKSAEAISQASGFVWAATLYIFTLLLVVSLIVCSWLIELIQFNSVPLSRHIIRVSHICFSLKSSYILGLIIVLLEYHFTLYRSWNITLYLYSFDSHYDFSMQLRSGQIVASKVWDIFRPFGRASDLVWQQMSRHLSLLHALMLACSMAPHTSEMTKTLGCVFLRSVRAM